MRDTRKHIRPCLKLGKSYGLASVVYSQPKTGFFVTVPFPLDYIEAKGNRGGYELSGQRNVFTPRKRRQQNRNAGASKAVSWGNSAEA